MIVILVLCILLLERDFCVCCQITSEYIATRLKSFSVSITAVALCHQFVKYINMMANNKRQTRWKILEQCRTKFPLTKCQNVFQIFEDATNKSACSLAKWLVFFGRISAFLDTPRRCSSMYIIGSLCYIISASRQLDTMAIVSTFNRVMGIIRSYLRNCPTHRRI